MQAVGEGKTAGRAQIRKPSPPRTQGFGVAAFGHQGDAGRRDGMGLLDREDFGEVFGGGDYKLESSL